MSIGTESPGNFLARGLSTRQQAEQNVDVVSIDCRGERSIENITRVNIEIVDLLYAQSRDGLYAHVSYALYMFHAIAQ